MSAKSAALKKLADGIEMIPASVLRRISKSPDVMRGETIEQMWQRTADELEPSLVSSIRKSGVKTPLSMNDGWLVDGHHRVLAALEVDPNMLIPVRTSTGFSPSTFRIKPATPEEKLFSQYLASSRFDASPDEIANLLDRYGYSGLLRSAQDNDPSWLDFRDVYKDNLR